MSSTERKVVITGMGAVTPIGLDVESFWSGLTTGRSGVGPITLFDTQPFPVKIAAEVRDFDPARYMSLKRMDRTGRAAQFGIAAARMAVESANLDLSNEDRDRIGVVIATSGMTGLIADAADVIKTRPTRIDPLLMTKSGQCMVGSQVGLELGAKGLNTTVNSACASGSDALGAAMSYIRLGYADVIIAGGTEAGVSAAALAMCSRVGALARETDPAKASRPFDLNRTGFVLGEGGGMLVLESWEHAQQRGAAILAEIAGCGWSFDAFNETAPDDAQQAAAMRNAIRNASLKPENIDYINAHGTGTKLNDCTETKAIKRVFAEKAFRLPVSSNKSMIGHLAAAAGAVEAIATIMTIRHGLIPATINYETRDPQCDLDYVPNTARRQPVNAALSNSFGMGGQNCCLVMKKYKEE
jgi:3-oxoacyl-[acyl-carrier-protein] synthase II